MGGPSTITYHDIIAWRDVTGVQPQPWELETILRLDGVFMDHVAAEQERTKPKP